MNWEAHRWGDLVGWNPRESRCRQVQLGKRFDPACVLLLCRRKLLGERLRRVIGQPDYPFHKDIARISEAAQQGLVDLRDVLSRQSVNSAGMERTSSVLDV